MSLPVADGGSFRDTAGRVYVSGNRIFRTVMPVAAEDFDFVRSTGLIERLTEGGKVVAESRVDAAELGESASGSAYVLEHPKLPFVSYPYEWPFAALKKAALLHLDIHIEALKHGVTMSDASAYNVQFCGARPIFIDSLSFRRYIEGEYWAGHRQFCDQFLNPLLLGALLGVPHNAWYRGSPEGIDADTLNALLPWHKKLSVNVLTHVTLQAGLQRTTAKHDKALQRAQARSLPLIGKEQFLRGLRKWISRLHLKEKHKTDWQDYEQGNSYGTQEESAKRDFVTRFVSTTAPKKLWDIGCNTGAYAKLALESGAGYVVGFDFDRGAVEAAFERSSTGNLNFLPLVFDAVNPSPDQGWAQAERKGLAQRADADALLALALLHHLVIAKNIPLESAVAWLVGLAPAGVVEFVEKPDPMVQRLLRLRDDIFDDYDRQTFERELQRHARIVASIKIPNLDRHLYWYARP